MENNEFLEGLAGVSDSMAMKSKEIQVVYLEELVKRNGLSSYSRTREYFENSEKKVEVTVFYKRYFCLHPCTGKESWGIEITNEPIKTHDKKIKQLADRLGYFIVCKKCLKICSACGGYTSRVSGEKVEDKWFCASCAKKHRRKKLWQDIKLAITGGAS
ncbi:hypothetical protein KAR91_27180 [Candidatus Pacearchaeota archaeon]|nr:hypothetical protein [Candidatus Pacearchaeota archaeon]